MRQDSQLSNFTKGEVSPRLKGRVDWEGYYDALDTCFNFVALAQGGATRRPGTRLAGVAQDQTNALFQETLVPFSFSTVQNYVLEVFPGGIGIYANDGQVLNGSNPVIVTTYQALGVALAVSGAANNGAGKVRLTVNTTAALATGQSVNVIGVAGTVEANGVNTIAVIDGTHVDLQVFYANAYTSGGVVLPYVATAVPYQPADLPFLQFTQSADTLYLCGGACPGNGGLGYPVLQLGRSSNTLWTATQILFRDGPYLTTPSPAATLTPSAATGAITVTASSTVGINATGQNAGQGFLASDVGRPLRLQVSGQNWGWCLITGWVSATEVAAVVMPAVTGGADASFGSAAATANWQLGAWSNTTGYAYSPMFWQQRLSLDGTNAQPNGTQASVSADFTNFAPTSDNGTVVATNALNWIMSDDQVNAVRWQMPAGSAAAMQLGIGTMGGEFVMQPATTSEALSGTNVQVYRETSYGSSPYAQPLRIGKAVLFANRPGRKVHEWQWSWAVNGYLGPDITVDAEHITRPQPATLPGIMEMAYQLSPYSVIWARRGDGQLIGCTYLPEQQVRAWHRHQLGGQYYGGAPIVESIATIPSPDGTYDELWLIVLRTVAGVPTRTVEVMTRYFDGLPQEQAFFVDCGLSSGLTQPNATLTPPATLVNAAPVVTVAPQFGGYLAAAVGAIPAGAQSGIFTASAAVFAGTQADVGQVIRINGGSAVVTAPIDTEHVTAQVLQPLFSLMPQAANGWSFTQPQTNFGDLGTLNGETVQILGDGADYGMAVVAAGGVALPANQGSASFATIGLPYWSVAVGMPWVPQGAAAQASQGRIKRMDHFFLRLYESLGCDFGMRRTDPETFAVDEITEALETRAANDLAGMPPPLFSGIVRLPAPGGFDQEQQFVVKTNGPMPLTIDSIGIRGDIGDLGAPP